MKRVLALVLCAIMAMGILPIFAAAQEVTAEEFEELSLSVDAALAIGDYEYYEKESNNTASKANLIGNDYTVYGVANGKEYDIDYYKFVLNKESKIQLLAMSSSSDLWISLEGNGVDLSEEELGKSGKYYAYLIEATLKPGTYYIDVIDFNAALYGMKNAYVFYLEWEPVNSHTHSYSVSKTVVPTCTSNGYTVMTCSCGDSYNTNTVAATGIHTYSDNSDTTCNVCGYVRQFSNVESVPMYRMYDSNGGEHFYTGSTVERDNLVAAGWDYEGVGFNFPVAGDPVHRLYHKPTGEHLYTMSEEEKAALLSSGWTYEGVAFNSAGKDEVPQYRLHNPNETRGAYHFTGSTVERDHLISLGWEYQGIGWYSCVK